MTKNHEKIRSRCLVHEFSLADLFNDINHGYRAAILKKSSLWLLPFYMAVATHNHYDKVRKRCALQLYRTSLTWTYRGRCYCLCFCCCCCCCLSAWFYISIDEVCFNFPTEYNIDSFSIQSFNQVEIERCKYYFYERPEFKGWYHCVNVPRLMFPRYCSKKAEIVKEILWKRRDCV